MNKKLPTTYIHDIGLAEAMAYAEIDQFNAAATAEDSGFLQSAIDLLTGVNNVGVIAANSYLANLDNSEKDEGQEIALEQMRTQVLAGRFAQCIQVKCKKEKIHNRAVER